MIRKAFFLFAVTLAFASLALSTTQNPAPQNPAPQDPGLVILNRACTVCHTLTEVTKFKGYWGRDQWADVVRTMRADGAQLKDDEVTPLVDYLFKTYGRVDPPKVDGKKLMEVSCDGCHGLDLVTSMKLGKADWQGIIERMLARGAELKADDIPTLAEYLAKNFGPQ